MSYACPYSDEELEKWDGVTHPMGNACNDCENYECEHNPNGDPSMPSPEDLILKEREDKEDESERATDYFREHGSNY